MVNTEQLDEIPLRRDKTPFQYPSPKVRASFTLQVVPDMLTSANLPGKNKQSRLEETSKQLIDNFKSKLPLEGALPGCNPQLPNTDYTAPDLKLKTYKPCISVPPTVNHYKQARVAANKSREPIDDDKDFEIPLEESLKAVEDFIKREKELSKWQVGEDVLAKWKGNGLYYKARILEIFASGVVTILFDTYDVKEDIDYHDMSKYFKKSSNYKKKGEPGPPEPPKENGDISDKNSSSSKEVSNDQASLIPYKHHSSFNSVVKRQNKSRKKIVLGAHHKGQKVMVIRSKKYKSKNKMCVIHPTVSDKEIKFYCPWG